MADKTGISWTDATWNPIVGCAVISPGCTNCYAMRDAARVVRCSEGAGRPTHYAGLVEPSKAGPVWTGKVALAPDHVLTKPLSWRKPRRVFVNSMGDLFHESVPDEWIDRVFAVMALAPQHTFQILTKRSSRMREYLSTRAGDWTTVWPDANPPGSLPVSRHEQRLRMSTAGADVRQVRFPLPNVWLGVTAEDQTRADERIPDLLATPAALRFVSIEPMLGDVDLKNITPADKYEVNALSGFDFDQSSAGPHLDWVIVGGESGPNARPMQVGLARSIVAQCRDARVPCFVKQLGSDPVWEDGAFLNLRHRKGATMSEWPADLHVQEIPNAR